MPLGGVHPITLRLCGVVRNLGWSRRDVVRKSARGTFGEVACRLRYFRSPWVSGYYNFSAALLPFDPKAKFRLMGQLVPPGAADPLNVEP
jgi:hypothetical protein